ncbi:MAG TPA: hypothetical protein VJZ73_13055 [Methylomirabilota bacterium]|nr:hypothetical protein [Methylomirabilota bacterium]
MQRTQGGGTGRRVVALLSLAAGLLGPAGVILAHPPQVADEPLSRFEQFLVEGCSPCVREALPIATLPVRPVTIPFSSRNVGVRTTRPGEIGVEALRAHLLGRPSRQLLAVRLTLSVATGSPGEMYRMAAGLIDEEEVGAFVTGLGEIIQATSGSTLRGGPDSVEIDQSSGNIRVGVGRVSAESIVYVQTGDLRLLTRRPVWEASSTVYLPVADLAALRNAIAQAAAKLQQLRSAQ